MNSDISIRAAAIPDIVHKVSVSPDKTVVVIQDERGNVLWQAIRQKKEAWLIKEYVAGGRLWRTHAVGLEHISDEIGRMIFG